MRSPISGYSRCGFVGAWTAGGVPALLAVCSQLTAVRHEPQPEDSLPYAPAEQATRLRHLDAETRMKHSFMKRGNDEDSCE